MHMSYCHRFVAVKSNLLSGSGSDNDSDSSWVSSSHSALLCEFLQPPTL